MRSFYLLFFSSILFFSCNSDGKSSEEVEGLKSIEIPELVKLDSIKVDFLGNPTVHDIDPESKTVLFMEHREYSEKIFIADFEGKILTSFSKFGDIPDTYGALMSTLKITSPNTFLVYGYKGFLTYDFDGNLLFQKKYENFFVPSQTRLGMGFGMEKLSKNKFLYINQESRPKTLSEYKDHYLLTVLDIEASKRHSVVNFPENSIFLNGNYYFSASWFPVYTIDSKTVYVAFGSEPVIYKFESSEPYHYKASIPLNLSNYKYGKGSDNTEDFNYMLMPFYSGRIENIKIVDEKFIVAYFPGFDELDTNSFLENKSREEAKDFRERMKKKYPSRIAIVDSSGNILNDFVPQGLEPSSMLLRDGQLWMMEKPDEEVERDYFRLFRVGLKVENN